jgi:hypothetical protein
MVLPILELLLDDLSRSLASLRAQYGRNRKVEGLVVANGALPVLGLVGAGQSGWSLVFWAYLAGRAPLGWIRYDTDSKWLLETHCLS